MTQIKIKFQTNLPCFYVKQTSIGVKLMVKSTAHIQHLNLFVKHFAKNMKVPLVGSMEYFVYLIEYLTFIKNI